MRTKREKGQKGEQIAWNYLKGKGYEMVHQNLRVGHREIDLVVRKDEWMVFVEVKLRSTDFFGPPETMISRKQERNIIEASDIYLKRIDWQGKARFDVVAIIRKKTETRILYIEDAFWPFHS